MVDFLIYVIREKGNERGIKSAFIFTAVMTSYHQHMVETVVS